jgi:hypothetical protein
VKKKAARRKKGTAKDAGLRSASVGFSALAGPRPTGKASSSSAGAPVATAALVSRSARGGTRAPADKRLAPLAPLAPASARKRASQPVFAQVECFDDDGSRAPIGPQDRFIPTGSPEIAQMGAQLKPVFDKCGKPIGFMQMAPECFDADSARCNSGGARFVPAGSPDTGHRGLRTVFDRCGLAIGFVAPPPALFDTSGAPVAPAMGADFVAATSRRTAPVRVVYGKAGALIGVL